MRESSSMSEECEINVGVIQGCVMSHACLVFLWVGHYLRTRLGNGCVLLDHVVTNW